VPGQEALGMDADKALRFMHRLYLSTILKNLPFIRIFMLSSMEE